MHVLCFVGFRMYLLLPYQFPTTPKSSGVWYGNSKLVPRYLTSVLACLRHITFFDSQSSRGGLHGRIGDQMELMQQKSEKKNPRSRGDWMDRRNSPI